MGIVTRVTESPVAYKRVDRHPGDETGYEYEIVNAPTSLLQFQTKREETERPADGWEFDGVVVS